MQIQKWMISMFEWHSFVTFIHVGHKITKSVNIQWITLPSRTDLSHPKIQFHYVEILRKIPAIEHTTHTIVMLLKRCRTSLTFTFVKNRIHFTLFVYEHVNEIVYPITKSIINQSLVVFSFPPLFSVVFFFCFCFEVCDDASRKERENPMATQTSTKINKISTIIICLKNDALQFLSYL